MKCILQKIRNIKYQTNMEQYFKKDNEEWFLS